MTLEKQNVGVPLLGLNTLSDPKSAAAGEFDLIENMWFNRTARGGAELRKRYGGAALSTSTIGGSGQAVGVGLRLATFGDERLMIGSKSAAAVDPGSLWSYSPSQSKWRPVSVQQDIGQSPLPNVGIVAEAVGASPNNYVATDVAVNAAGTLMCVVWKETGTGTFFTYMAVIDLVTNEKILTLYDNNSVGGAAGWVRVIALASNFIVFFGSVTANTIKATTIAYSGLGQATTTPITDLNASGKADVIKNGSADEVVLAYHSTTPNTKISRISNSGAVQATVSNAEIPSQAIGWVNWDGSDGNEYLAFVSAVTGAKVFTVVQSPLSISATTTMDAAVTAAANITGFRTAAAAQFNVYIEVRAAATYNALIRRWPGSGATSIVQRSVGLAAGCFKLGGRYYLPVAYDSSLQSGYYLLDVSSQSGIITVVARALYGLGGGLTTAASLPMTAAASATQQVWPVMKLVQNPNGTKVFASALLRMDFGATSVSGAKRVGEQLHLSGGSTRAYDGLSLNELGFYNFPETPTLAQGGGGSMTLLGSYQYAVVYAWPDQRGQWHRSAPSPIASITLTGANNSVSLTVPTLRLSNKDSIGLFVGDTRVFVEVYRTVASGTTFYRVFVSGVPVLSTQQADTVAVNDINSDATIQANEILYTTGKVLPRIGPPSARLMESWRNRLFLAGTENPNELWVSNEYSPGLGGVSFSDALVMQFESDQGPITALCEMDDRLLVFKRNAIYVLTGNGPTLTGDNQFQAAQRLTAIVGAVEQRGVVKTRDGVMFKSTRGIYLLSHAGAIIYVGAGVDTYNSLTVTGACLLEDDEQVRFTTAEGRTLVYHYGILGEDGIGKWTTFTNQPAVDCIVWNGKFVFLKSDATVIEETVGAYTDPGSTSINAKIRLAWLSLTQFFGRFKLYGISLLGDLLATFTLTHRIAYDYDATVTESETKAVTVATLPPLQLSPARRRATAVQVTLEETSTTQGFTVSGWGLEVGVEPGAIKQGTGQFLT